MKLKVTGNPSGGGPEGVLSVAVNVTGCPNSIEEAEDVRAIVTTALWTVRVSEDEALAATFELPAYDAVTWSIPTGKSAVIAPEFPPTMEVPSTVEVGGRNEENVTLPVATPPNWGEIVAVNVTGVLANTLEQFEQVSEIVLDAWLTIWLRVVEVLAEKFTSPL